MNSNDVNSIINNLCDKLGTIYREDAIKAISLRARIPHDVASAHYASMAINAIRSVPSADRPKGEWIMHIDDLFPCESTQECSVCHAEQLINGNDDNYCPNCGAKMDGEREGE